MTKIFPNFRKILSPQNEPQAQEIWKSKARHKITSRHEVQERVNNEAMGSRNVQKRMIKKQKVKLIKRTDYLSGNMYREIQWEGMKAVKEYKAFKQKKIKIVDLWGIGS